MFTPDTINEVEQTERELFGEFSIPDRSILLADGSRGIHIPWFFGQLIANDGWTVEGVNPDDHLVLLEGPDHPDYWGAWDEVIQHAKIKVESSGSVRSYILHHDDDLWLIPTDEEGGE